MFASHVDQKGKSLLDFDLSGYEAKLGTHALSIDRSEIHKLGQRHGKACLIVISLTCLRRHS